MSAYIQAKTPEGVTVLSEHWDYVPAVGDTITGRYAQQYEIVHRTWTTGNDVNLSVKPKS